MPTDQIAATLPRGARHRAPVGFEAVSDTWDFYPTCVDDKPASIFVDLSIARAAPMRALPHMAHLRVHMNAPRPDGLSSQAEFAALTALEDRLSAGLSDERSTIYVGRNTSNGVRDFYFYTSCPDDWESRVAEFMLSSAEYRFECGVRVDAEWQTYFRFLYPSKEDRRRMKNRRVFEALKERGDNLTEAREIDHWAYFPTDEARSAFIARAAALGFELRCTSEPEKEGERFGAQIFHVARPSPDAIDDVTVRLFALAEELGGDYDGWETPVIT
jgi:uncharacterized protein (TIGR01619 family)